MDTPKVGMVSLGCPKALVDTERLLTTLIGRGYTIVPDYAQADVVLVNTCGFIEAAETESLEAIEEALNANGRVIVTGCLGSRAPVIQARFPEVLAVTGPQAPEAVLAAVEAAHPVSPAACAPTLPPQGVRLTPAHYAYLKIAEGCDHRCSFCVIPQLRGRLISRPAAAVMQEAADLVAAGVRELLVIGQDTGVYGADLRHATSLWQDRQLPARLDQLAVALGELGVWVRLHYIYPHRHVDRLIPLMADGYILPYLDMPLQHASRHILQAMRRPAAMEATLERLQAWRARCPELVVRSTFIVGFPGETEADFEQLLDFLEAAQLDRVGCFTYSEVTGAAANAFADPVPPSERQARHAELLERQAQISRERLARRIGTVTEVLVDAATPEHIMARSPVEAPEVDGVVWLPPIEGIEPGDMLEVRLTANDEHDLYAEPVLL